MEKIILKQYNQTKERLMEFMTMTGGGDRSEALKKRTTYK